MELSRRHMALACAGFMLGTLAACAGTAGGLPPKPYRPAVGQPGKDVVWVPTPDAVVERMLDMARVTSTDYLVDLGSGDGKIAIAAAKRGARARGIEFNRKLVDLSKRNARAHGVQVEFVQGDIFASDFSDADVITLYLLPELNERLRPILFNMKPGTRVTSHQFGMGEWEPDRTDRVDGRLAHLWIVPARIAGAWNVMVVDEPAFQVHFEQEYQRLDGHSTRGGSRLALLEPKVQGNIVSFKVLDPASGVMHLDGKVEDHGRMTGIATLPNGLRKTFTAVR